VKCQKQAATCGAYRVANQQRMAARRALEWIGTLKARLVFRYEISDLFLNKFDSLFVGEVIGESLSHNHENVSIALSSGSG